jgi:septation ring formation regulator EzrA
MELSWIIGTALAIANAWTLILYKGIKDDIKEIREVSSRNSTSVAVSESSLSSIKSDVVSIKQDLHSSSSAVLESFNKLDARLHSFIIRQSSNKHD